MIHERLRAVLEREIRKKTETFPAKPSQFRKEIEDCIEYFEKLYPAKTKNKNNGFSVHGARVEIGRISGKKPQLYFARDILYSPGLPPYRETITIENNALVRSKKKYPNGEDIGWEAVTRGQLKEMIDKIHGITLPYAQHVQNKSK